MKILLSNQSSSFSQVIQDTKVILEWNTKIGFGIYIYCEMLDKLRFYE